MKILQSQHAWLKTGFWKLSVVLFLLFVAGCKKGDYTPTAKVTTIASGLMGPMGIETDRMGNIWVAQTGTAMNDGSVVVISPNSGYSKSGWTTSVAIINLSSIHNALSGEVEGPAHMLLDNGMMYVLAGDYLYKINVSSFKPGDPPIDASKLPFENIGAYVRTLNIVTPNDSHPYNLIKGPDGDIYIVDAGANAIIHRKSAGHYTVLAKLPDLTNALAPPPTIQAVPTGIIFDGRNFLVSTLSGGPFPTGQSVIYKVSLRGNVSFYQTGFTTLTGIADGNNMYGHVVMHFGAFTGMGFAANTGSLILVNGSMSKTMLDGLNMPAGLKQINDHSWYVSSLGDGTLLKVTYE